MQLRGSWGAGERMVRASMSGLAGGRDCEKGGY